jgi:hypothetical protein
VPHFCLDLLKEEGTMENIKNPQRFANYTCAQKMVGKLFWPWAMVHQPG